jgi:hypothetical protein
VQQADSCSESAPSLTQQNTSAEEDPAELAANESIVVKAKDAMKPLKS